jgi:hypothetical protein
MWVSQFQNGSIISLHVPDTRATQISAPGMSTVYEGAFQKSLEHDTLSYFLLINKVIQRLFSYTPSTILALASILGIILLL